MATLEERIAKVLAEQDWLDWESLNELTKKEYLEKAYHVKEVLKDWLFEGAR